MLHSGDLPKVSRLRRFRGRHTPSANRRPTRTTRRSPGSESRGRRGNAGNNVTRLPVQRQSSGSPSRSAELQRLRTVGANSPQASDRRRKESRPPSAASRPSQRGQPKGKKRKPAPGSPPPPAKTARRTRGRREGRPKPARRPQKRFLSPLVYAMRLLILGIGMSAIAGTVLSLSNPASDSLSRTPADAQSTATARSRVSPNAVLQLRQELSQLKTSVEAIANESPELIPAVFVFDLDTGAYLDINGDTAIAAASTIKVPILVAFFQAVDEGKIRLNETLTMEEEHIAEGSGQMQYAEPGTEYTALETARQTIVASDNTATNMLIDRLGGIEVLNQKFQTWGLHATALRNPLPDLEGTNTTTPKEMAKLLAMVSQGELISLRSRDRLLDIMQATWNDDLLPQGLGKGAKIAHKTGNLGSVLADVGLIDLPNGKRYIATVLIERPHNDQRAYDAIRRISRAAYETFERPAGPPPSAVVDARPDPYRRGESDTSLRDTLRERP